MLLYRITQNRFANLDGIGGLLTSSRWNEKGNRIVYLAENRSLALLEFLVNVGSFDILPRDIVLLTVETPDRFQSIKTTRLKKNWKTKVIHSRRIGTEFLTRNDELLLRVPSVIIPGEHNFLMNPANKLSEQCEIVDSVPLELDKRLFR